MEDSTITLIVGLAGITGTLTSSIVGHYYTSKARKSAYQQTLFNEQLVLIKKIHKQIGTLKNTVPLLLNKDDNFYEKAHQNLSECIPQLDDLSHEAAALLPSELWVDFEQLVNKTAELLSKDISERTIEDVRDIASGAATFAVSSRVILGVDELTIETSNFLTGSTGDELLGKGARDELIEIAKNRLKSK